MTTETIVVDTTVVDAANVAKGGNTPEGEQQKELSPVEKELAELKAEKVKDAELLKKLRKFEKENKDAADKALLESGKFKELYEAEKLARESIEGKVKSQTLDSALKAELANVKAKAPDTVLKLLDKSAIQWNDDGSVDTKSIQKALKDLQKSDPILFEEEVTTETPAVKRAGEGDVVGGYEKEIRSCKTAREIETVLRKYGKMQ